MIVVSTALATAYIGQHMIRSGQRAVVAMTKGIFEAVGLGGFGSGCAGDIEVGVKVERVSGLHFVAHVAFIRSESIDLLRMIDQVLLIDGCRLRVRAVRIG